MGYFTFRLAGFFFLLSAVIEIASINAAAPVLGAMRGGSVGVAYHLAYIGVFAAMGLGLWGLETWGPAAIYAGTALYSADRFAYLLIDPTLGYDALLAALDPNLVKTATTGASLIALACWWGFAGYVYARRRSFAG